MQKGTGKRKRKFHVFLGMHFIWRHLIRLNMRVEKNRLDWYNLAP